MALPEVAANTRSPIARFQVLVGPAIFAEAAIAGLLTTASKLRMTAVRMWGVFGFRSCSVITGGSQLDWIFAVAADIGLKQSNSNWGSTLLVFEAGHDAQTCHY